MSDTVVGAPNNLSDLHRIKSQVRVTCRSCRAIRVWELNDLIEEVRRNGGNTDWCAARRSIKCIKLCLSPIVSLLPILYGRQRARRREHRHALVNLSLQVMRAGADRSATEAVGTSTSGSRCTFCGPSHGSNRFSPPSGEQGRPNRATRGPAVICHTGRSCSG